MKYASILSCNLWRNSTFYPLENTDFPVLWNKRSNRSLLAQQQCSNNKDYSKDLDVDDRIILKYVESRLHCWKVRSSNPDRGVKFFSSRKHPNRLWGPPNVLFNGYWGYFLGARWPEPLLPTAEFTLCAEIFFKILAHSVFKMWILQEPKEISLWNKRHLEEKRTEIVQHV